MTATVTVNLPDVHDVISLNTQPAKAKIGSQILVFINGVTYIYTTYIYIYIYVYIYKTGTYPLCFRNTVDTMNHIVNKQLFILFINVLAVHVSVITYNGRNMQTR